MEKELWLPIENYEGIYEVSNMGNVRTLGRKIRHSRDGYDRWHYGQLLSLCPNRKRSNYVYVTLKKPGVKNINTSVHRLVAKAFINNPNDLPQVNHKNFNTQDNRRENLEWMSAKENNNYSSDNGRRKNMRGLHGNKVAAYNKAGEKIGEYNTIREAARQLNVFGQNICAVLGGRHKYAKGYTFKRVA